MSELPASYLRFVPILKERIWGGSRLRRFGFELPSAPIGEAWLLSDLAAPVVGGESVVDGGTWSGRTVGALLRAHRVAILGAARTTADGRFPLLIKLLDAAANLSVQVHPTPEYMARHPLAVVKNEAWVILEAVPDAVLYTGLHADVDLGTFRKLAEDGELERALVSVPARVGDCHLLTSGTCHALGAGIVVAEIQTPSDTTFRVHDWGRSGRELHLDQAIDCIYGVGAADDALPLVRPTTPLDAESLPTIDAGHVRTRSLARTGDFTIERVDAVRDTTLDVVTNGQPVIWLAVDGTVELLARSADGTGPLAPGHLALVPACAQGTSLRLAAGAAVLRVDLPSPMDAMIA